MTSPQLNHLAPLSPEHSNGSEHLLRAFAGLSRCSTSLATLNESISARVSPPTSTSTPPASKTWRPTFASLGAGSVFVGTLLTALLGLAIMAFAGCGAPPDEPIATTKSALVYGYCTDAPYTTPAPANKAYIYLNDGECATVSVGEVVNAAAQFGSYIYAASVGPGVSLWGCVSSTLFSGYSPCYDGREYRTDGTTAMRYFPGPVGSAKLAVWLPEPPNCFSFPPTVDDTNCHSTADSPHPNHVLRSNGNPITRNYPSGDTGGPCKVMLNGTTVVLNYACPTY